MAKNENWLSIMYNLFTSQKTIQNLIYRKADSNEPEDIFAIKTEDGVLVFLESFDEPVTPEKWAAVQKLASWCPVSYISKKTNEVHTYSRFAVPV